MLNKQPDRICFELLKGFVEKDKCQELKDPDLREIIKQRLEDVGYELIDKPAATVYATAPIVAFEDMEGYFKGEKLNTAVSAMLVVIWAKLRFPKLAGMTGKPFIPKKQLERFLVDERKLFSKTAFNATIGRLKTLNYIRERNNGAIEAGESLLVFVDDETMAERLSNSIISSEIFDVEQKKMVDEQDKKLLQDMKISKAVDKMDSLF